MGSRLAYSTGPRAALRLIPRVVRGSLVHQVGATAFSDFRQAVCAWSALHELHARDRPDQGDAQ